MRLRYIISENWSNEYIHEVVDAIKFAINFYDIANDKATLTVKLINGNNTELVEATAYRIKNNRYELRMARKHIPNTLDATLVALFHEMTHVKQFVKNGFLLQSNRAKWNNEVISLATSGASAETIAQNYWFSPWEMEARAMERALVALYSETR